MVYRTLIGWMVGVVLVGMLGCGGKPDTAPTAKVTGTVTYKGQPAQRASVGFIPDGGPGGRPASGTTDASGKFTLTTFAPSDGAVPGKHKVVITEASGSSEPPPMPGMPGYKEKKSKFPAKYGNPQTTTLSAEVKPGGPNDFTFDMTD